METRYLLPCSCDRKIPIKLSQAGQTVKCDCGAELEVPTMHAIQELECVVLKPKHNTVPTTKSWDSRRACILLGSVVTIAAIIMFVHFQWTRPKLRPIEQYPPLTTWSLWQTLRQGVIRRPSPAEKQFFDNLTNNQRWTNVTLVMAGVGVMIMLGSFVMRGSRTNQARPKSKPRAPTKPFT